MLRRRSSLSARIFRKRVVYQDSRIRGNILTWHCPSQMYLLMWMTLFVRSYPQPNLMLPAPYQQNQPPMMMDSFPLTNNHPNGDFHPPPGFSGLAPRQVFQVPPSSAGVLNLGIANKADGRRSVNRSEVIRDVKPWQVAHSPSDSRRSKFSGSHSEGRFLWPDANYLLACSSEAALRNSYQNAPFEMIAHEVHGILPVRVSIWWVSCRATVIQSYLFETRGCRYNSALLVPHEPIRMWMDELDATVVYNDSFDPVKYPWKVRKNFHAENPRLNGENIFWTATCLFGKLLQDMWRNLCSFSPKCQNLDDVSKHRPGALQESANLQMLFQELPFQTEEILYMFSNDQRKKRRENALEFMWWSPALICCTCVALQVENFFAFYSQTFYHFVHKHHEEEEEASIHLSEMPTDLRPASTGLWSHAMTCIPPHVTRRCGSESAAAEVCASRTWLGFTLSSDCRACFALFIHADGYDRLTQVCVLSWCEHMHDPVCK